MPCIIVNGGLNRGSTFRAGSFHCFKRQYERLSFPLNQIVEEMTQLTDRDQYSENGPAHPPPSQRPKSNSEDRHESEREEEIPMDAVLRDVFLGEIVSQHDRLFRVRV